MTLKRSLALPAEPSSVRLARVWVGEVLTEIGRDDLVLTAQLGVSELVTNALMHARPPLTVGLRGSVEHPRIEVTDHTPGLRAGSLAIVDGASYPTTFGRGLALVSMNSAEWGTTPDTDGIGKKVWFEPAQEMHEETDLDSVLEDALLDLYDDHEGPPADSLTIVLGNVPATLFAQLRRYHFELRRELRLLALSDRVKYPVAAELSDLFRQADAERTSSSGVSKLDDAIAAELPVVDLEYAVPTTTPGTMARLDVLLERCYDTIAADGLLAMAPPALLRRLQTWYFGEFVRQGRGEAPTSWDGPTRMPRTQSRSGGRAS